MSSREPIEDTRPLSQPSASNDGIGKKSCLVNPSDPSSPLKLRLTVRFEDSPTASESESSHTVVDSPDEMHSDHTVDSPEQMELTDSSYDTDDEDDEEQETWDHEQAVRNRSIRRRKRLLARILEQEALERETECDERMEEDVEEDNDDWYSEMDYYYSQ